MGKLAKHNIPHKLFMHNCDAELWQHLSPCKGFHPRVSLLAKPAEKQAILQIFVSFKPATQPFHYISWVGVSGFQGGQMELFR